MTEPIVQMTPFAYRAFWLRVAVGVIAGFVVLVVAMLCAIRWWLIPTLIRLLGERS
jgi:hypothetical protein